MLGAARSAVLGAALSLVFCASASALTVEVRDDFPVDEFVTIEGRDRNAEPNEVTARMSGAAGGLTEFEIVDRLSPTTAGTGCRGGGAPGVPVFCQLPPLSEKALPLTFALGAGDNSLDASTLDLRVGYVGGAGADVFVGGSGDDDVHPGGGGNAIYAKDGDDRLTAPAEPSGRSRYHLGQGFDFLSYQLAKEPVSLLGGLVDTAAGMDRLQGVEWFRGGRSDDFLSATASGSFFRAPRYELLDGTDGDDLIVGGDTGATLVGERGDDTLVAGGRVLGSVGRPAAITYLVGEDGDDRYFGGDGADVIREYELEGRGFAPVGHRDRASDDLARGAGGNDLIELGAGQDKAQGNAGNDGLDLGRGPDLGAGGAGRDLMIGDLGLDGLLGGGGRDRILAAYGSSPGSPRLVDRPDRILCGDSRDFALVNPWDRHRECEASRVWTQPNR